MNDAFTHKQAHDLDVRAEERDLDLKRESILSYGEHQELDDRDKVRGTANFTDEQIADLHERAEKRDLTRPRRSHFSVGEQGSLDTTAETLRLETEMVARNVGFNRPQQRELDRRFRKRLLPILAYLLLAAASAYAVGTSRDAAFHHSNQNRQQITEITRRVTYNNCLGNNEFRSVLRGILLGSIPQTEKYVKEHTITQAQANRAIAQTRADAAKLQGRNCAALVAQLK